MAMEPSFFEQESRFESDGDVSLKRKWNPISEATKELEKSSGCFDCSICFDSAKEPVVTLCGHLYCWPCIYKWLNVQPSSLYGDPKQKKNCPVCKANISIGSLVPLYGHGTSSQSRSESKNPNSDMVIPQRPTPSASNITTTTSHMNHHFFHSRSQTFHDQHYFPHPSGGYATLASSSDLGGVAMTNCFLPMIGMLGEMVVDARVFGSSNQGSYPLLRNNNLRMRRQEIKIARSLSRVSMFLFCCIILCLLLF